MQPNIINLYTVDDIGKWLEEKNNIYIGRSTREIPSGSKWGNLYLLRVWKSRNKVVRLYENYLKQDEDLLNSIDSLKGKTLGCWCSPSLCHGEILHKLAGNVPIYQPVVDTVSEQVSKMSQHDHLTRMSTGSLTKIDSKSKLLTPKSTKKKISIEDLNAQIEHQNLLIQQLLDEANVTKETIANLRDEIEEHKKEKEDLQVKVGCLNESVEKILVDSVCNAEENVKMGETISILEEKLSDESAIHTGNRMKMEIDLRNEYDAKINKLNKQVHHLESAKAYTDSILVVKDKVHELLAKRITHLEQYTRRYSVVVKGIAYRENEVREGKLEEDVRNLLQESTSTATFQDIDKFHRNGPRFETKQDLLIRFKSHSAKENFYRSRKSMKRRGVKVQPSLSVETKSVLDEAKEHIANYDGYGLVNPPDLVMADLHGNLWVKFKNQTNENQMFYKFDSIEKLSEIVDKYNTDGTIMDNRELDFNRFD